MATHTNERLHSLDTLRGVTQISMIAYHGIWNLVHLFGKKIPWYTGVAGYLWQQSICWTFIVLSGFCISLGTHPVKRGLQIFAGGLLVSAVTYLVMPSNRITFGILTFSGSCMILIGLTDRWLKRIPAWIGAAVCAVMFVLLRNCNRGFLGFEGMILGPLPEEWYRNLLTTYLGFPAPGFWSPDYFSIFPWIFLFLFGYFLFSLFHNRSLLTNTLTGKDIPVINWIGRHSLLVYLIHQPVLYCMCILLKLSVDHGV